MPLKLALPNLDDVPEPLRAAYRPRADGKGYELDLLDEVVPATTHAATVRQLEEIAVAQEVGRAALELGAHRSALDDITARIRPRFKVGEDNKPFAVDAQGNRVFGEDGNPLRVAGAVRRLTIEAPHLFGAAGSGPAGAARPTANPWRKESWSVTEQMKLLKADRQLAEGLAADAGQKI